jgi:7,8-dihydropterin-6-yl-methyl-4-(beta-D-ribofuranosyl)aminobenzene 5'-phosphate synthase
MNLGGVIVGVVGALCVLVLLIAGVLAIRFVRGRRRADRAWAAARFPKLENLGSVSHLSVLPLIDGRASREDLACEPGVSYLVRADDYTILFDLGLNERAGHPSPLLRNMWALGVRLEEVDCIVVSHLHLDHVGGMRAQRKRTFALSAQPVGLRGIRALVPVPMEHPTARVGVVEAPRAIAPGVATLGPIPRQLFFFGWTPEQALAVNVKGKGIVLICGCGHPTLQRMVARAEMLFDQPLYGIVGGLHYPVGGRRRLRLFGTGKWPWAPIDEREVEASISALQQRHPELVALSPHDSSDWTLRAFRRAFGDACREILVGREIVVS